LSCCRTLSNSLNHILTLLISDHEFRGLKQHMQGSARRLAGVVGRESMSRWHLRVLSQAR